MSSTVFKTRRAVTNWLFLGIFLILAMVVIGGMTRLTHSGLSMVNWSFAGSLPPLTEEAWISEFEGYQQSPEYKEVHSHFTLSDFKSIYWWEYIHRMWGRMIGIVFIIPFIFFLVKKWIPKDLILHFFVILGLGSFQALLGWFMVRSGLVDVPRVSHYRLAAHLSTAFIACCYVFWVALKYKNYNHIRLDVKEQRGMVWGFTGLLFVQIIYGAFVAGLRAGWIHNTWPLMDGHLIAPAVSALDPWFMNILEGRSGVQFVHRTLALIVAAFSVLLYLKARNWDDDRRHSAQFVIAAVILQVILGVLTLLLEVPTALGVMHQVAALIVLLTSIRLLFFSTYSSTQVKVSIK